MNAPSPATPPTPLRWQGAIKASLIVHGLLTLLAIPMVIGLVGYGLAHASDGAAGALMLKLLAVAAVLIGAPLALLLKRNGPLELVLKGVGLLALVAGSGSALVLLGYLTLQPTWIGARFESAMKPLRISAVRDEPLLLQGRPVGLRVVADLDLPNAMPLDAHGMAVLELLDSLWVAKAKGGGPFDLRSAARVTFQGVALEALPEVIKAKARSRSDGDPSVKLPAGTYRIERDFWLIGLGQAEGGWANDPRTLCRQDGPDMPRQLTELAQGDGQALSASVGVRFSLGGRRGYRHFNLDAPIKHRHDHAAWLADLAALDLPGCSGQTERVRVATDRERYLSGNDSQLEHKVCAGDLDGVRELLALRPPGRALWRQLSQCTIDKPQPEMFALLLPPLHAQSLTLQLEPYDTGPYCGLLRTLHNHGNLEALTRVAELKLPLVCEHKGEAEMWRNGFDPSEPSLTDGPRRAARPLNDTTLLQWLALMKRSGVPLCKPAPDGTTLLQLSVKHRSAPVIEFLLDAGCDPHAPAPAKKRLEGGNQGLPADDHMQPILPVAGWTLRRFRAPDSRSTSPIDAARVAAITRRMGSLRADEINRVEPVHGAPFLFTYRSEVRRSPALLHHLVQQGARLDAADAFGTSWFDGMISDARPDDPRHKPFGMLDFLTDAQMRELLSPKNRPLDQITGDWWGPDSLRTYLCKRRLGPCQKQ